MPSPSVTRADVPGRWQSLPEPPSSRIPNLPLTSQEKVWVLWPWATPFCLALLVSLTEDTWGEGGWVLPTIRWPLHSPRPQHRRRTHRRSLATAGSSTPAQQVLSRWPESRDKRLEAQEDHKELVARSPPLPLPLPGREKARSSWAGRVKGPTAKGARPSWGQ